MGKIKLLAILTLAISNNAAANSKERNQRKHKSSFNTGYGTQEESKSKKPPLLRYGLAAGLGIPEFFPLSGLVKIGSYFALSGYLVPPLPFNIRVELGEDTISTSNNIEISHPDLDINFDAVYGPQVGLDLWYFPFGENWFLGAGAGFRMLTLDGEVSSPLIIGSAGSDGVETDTVYTIGAEANTAQYTLRVTTGFYWEFFGNMFASVTLMGISQPYKAQSQVDVESSVVNRALADPDTDLGEDFREFQKVKEEELEDKALKSLRPVEELLLPVLGFSIGFFI